MKGDFRWILRNILETKSPTLFLAMFDHIKGNVFLAMFVELSSRRKLLVLESDDRGQVGSWRKHSHCGETCVLGARRL